MTSPPPLLFLPPSPLSACEVLGSAGGDGGGGVFPCVIILRHPHPGDPIPEPGVVAVTKPPLDFGLIGPELATEPQGRVGSA